MRSHVLHSKNNGRAGLASVCIARSCRPSLPNQLPPPTRPAPLRWPTGQLCCRELQPTGQGYFQAAAVLSVWTASHQCFLQAMFAAMVPGQHNLPLAVFPACMQHAQAAMCCALLPACLPACLPARLVRLPPARQPPANMRRACCRALPRSGAAVHWRRWPAQRRAAGGPGVCHDALHRGGGDWLYRHLRGSGPLLCHLR